MSRIVLHDAHAPFRIPSSDLEGKDLYLCACGLSQNKPYCDSSHKVTLDEEDGKVYRYAGDTRDGARTTLES